MGAVGAPVARLRLSEHPLQRCGAWAVAVLCDRERPEQVSGSDLDAVAERVVSDVVVAATARPDTAAYDWWKVLFALYPNSRATHAKRERDPARLRPEIGAMFAPDPAEGALLPCTFCGEPCSVLWSKSMLPMFDSVRAVNTLPPGLAGWPVCRSCRVALWALPYGAWVTAGSATVVTSDSQMVERRVVARNVRRAGRILQSGFEGLPAGAGPEAVTLQALRAHSTERAVTATLWTFKNDNQEPWLRITATRSGVARFLALMLSDSDCRQGWWKLRKHLEWRDKSGRVIQDGATAAARTLFNPDGRQVDRLPAELLRLAKDTDRVTESTLFEWRALCRLYLEVMHEMKTDIGELKKLAGLLVDWIDDKQNPRSKFNEYRQVAGSGYELHKLLMRAMSRLYLDGRKPLDITGITNRGLFEPGSPGWLLRAQLFFEVMAELAKRDISIAGKADDTDEDEQAEMRFDLSADPLSTDEEEYA